MTLAWESPKAQRSPDTEVSFEECGEVRAFPEVKLRDLGVTVSVRTRDWHSVCGVRSMVWGRGDTLRGRELLTPGPDTSWLC